MQVQKRDGTIVPFVPEKVQNAIYRAAFEVLQDSRQADTIAARLAGIVAQSSATGAKGKPLHVETIQDLVETVLMSEGYSQIAKSYILYRERRSEIRLAKSVLGMKDDLKLPLNTMEVLKRRYLLKDDRAEHHRNPQHALPAGRPPRRRGPNETSSPHRARKRRRRSSIR